jgi:hypothetical protein
LRGHAEPEEVLVSSTVKDLVAGSGIASTDRGVWELKGVPGDWRLFAVNRSPCNRWSFGEPHGKRDEPIQDVCPRCASRGEATAFDLSVMAPVH